MRFSSWQLSYRKLSNSPILRRVECCRISAQASIMHLLVEQVVSTHKSWTVKNCMTFRLTNKIKDYLLCSSTDRQSLAWDVEETGGFIAWKYRNATECWPWHISACRTRSCCHSNWHWEAAGWRSSSNELCKEGMCEFTTVSPVTRKQFRCLGPFKRKKNAIPPGGRYGRAARGLGLVSQVQSGWQMQWGKTPPTPPPWWGRNT